MKGRRDQVADRHGKTLTPGTKVKVVGEDGQPQGEVVRVLPDYQVLTVVIPEGRSQVERMYRLSDVEAL